jgi:hypothetical protein
MHASLTLAKRLPLAGVEMNNMPKGKDERLDRRPRRRLLEGAPSAREGAEEAQAGAPVEISAHH